MEPYGAKCDVTVTSQRERVRNILPRCMSQCRLDTKSSHEPSQSHGGRYSDRARPVQTSVCVDLQCCLVVAVVSKQCHTARRSRLSRSQLRLSSQQSAVSSPLSQQSSVSDQPSTVNGVVFVHGEVPNQTTSHGQEFQQEFRQGPKYRC